MTIRLPEVELRDAILSEDWDRAEQILSDHVLTVQRAVDNPPENVSEADWHALLEQQDAFRNELAINQAQVGHLLERVRKQSAGVRAYRKRGL